MVPSDPEKVCNSAKPVPLVLIVKNVPRSDAGPAARRCAHKKHAIEFPARVDPAWSKRRLNLRSDGLKTQVARAPSLFTLKIAPGTFKSLSACIAMPYNTPSYPSITAAPGEKATSTCPVSFVVQNE